MGYENVGAYVDGKRPASKKALREALASTPEKVHFDSTSMFTNGQDYYPGSIPAGLKLSVVGPDPYSRRNWYATVELNAAGKLKIS